MKKTVPLLIIFLLFAPIAFAEKGHMKLLAVREIENGTYEGGVADLYLEIKPGTGRVFLETFPLTKTDTQMSTRLAKAVACDLTQKDCDVFDFFYTITADSAIIAGPSAGSSLAVLTAAMLEGFDLNEKYAATGTINSGGLIGPVGGVKEKVEAAKAIGLKKVLIPSGEMIVTAGNETTNLSYLSKQIGIQVVEVSTLDEALKEFTGKEIKQNYRDINIDSQYKDTMRFLSQSLCNRSKKLQQETKNLKANNNITKALREEATNLTSKAQAAYNSGTYYSSASYCFGANVEYSTLALYTKNLSKATMQQEISKLSSQIEDFSKEIDKRKRETITDLESFMVIKERLNEAKDTLDEAKKLLNATNSTERIIRPIAFAQERINSAYSWASFFGKGGKKFNLNSDVLKKSCQAKISEADERVQYVQLYLPASLASVQKSIKKAQEELRNGNYELCLSTASKAAADVDIVLSVFGVDPGQYKNLLERKLEIVRNNIARQSSKGLFPILGYSYYEYANSLKDSDLFSAMLYSEYALELGNLDIYFKETNGNTKNRIPQPFEFDWKLVSIFLFGIVVGSLITVVVLKSRIRTKDSKRKKKRRLYS